MSRGPYKRSRERRVASARASVLATAAVLAVVQMASAGATNSWPQWGGADRNFRVEGVTLADGWEARPPRLLWDRPLGNGHSAIVSDGIKLYTMFGEAGAATVIALDPESGDTAWEHSFDADYSSHMEEYDGPHATPLVVGTTLVVVGIDAQVLALDTASGSVIWSRDLVRELGMKLPQSGYGASPIAWEDTVILPGLGGSGPGAVSLRLRDGETVWARHSFRSSHASPILIRFDGGENVVFHGMDWLYGLDPANGDVLFAHLVRRNAADNVSFTPLWDATRDRVYISHGYDSRGALALQLTRGENGTVVEDVWNNGRVRINHGNAVFVDDVLYGSPADSFFAALDVVTGELDWKVRIPKATVLAADGKLLLLDEEGALYLAVPQPDGLKISGRLQILEYNAWTIPTLVGTRLYVRDRERIKALQLF